MIGEYSLRGTKNAKICSKSNVHHSYPFGGDEYLWQYYTSGTLGYGAGWNPSPDVQVVRGKN